MKKTIKLALVAAMALGTTSAFATNGSALIATGAKARGMGGTDIGVSHGAESALANPALITSVEGTEVQFGGTLFMPDVSYKMKSTGGLVPAGTTLADGQSAADMSMIPSVSLATKVNDNFYWGVGMWGTAGMGVDYRDEGGMEMVTNLQLMQFGVPLTYAISGFSVGVTPVLQYGALDINYNNGNTDPNYAGTGAGIAQDLAFGFNLGAAYQIADVTIGLAYKSQIDMEYKGQLSSATAPFAGMGIFSEPMGDKLSTPAEIGFGASYNIAGSTIAFDYKQIKWSDAEGYKDFGWEDQDVFALGYEFAAESWAVRAGYNYAENPIKDAGAIALADFGGTMTEFGGNALNTFNLQGFPATVESHITLGGTYNFSKQTSVDLAYVYGLESETKLATMPADANTDGNPDTDTETTVTHSQQSLSVQLNYAF